MRKFFGILITATVLAGIAIVGYGETHYPKQMTVIEQTFEETVFVDSQDELWTIDRDDTLSIGDIVTCNMFVGKTSSMYDDVIVDYRVDK